MTPLIQDLNEHIGKDSRFYWTFWIKYAGPPGSGKSHAISGFRYWPDTRVVGTPGRNTGEGRFQTTSKLSAPLYNEILETLEAHPTVQEYRAYQKETNSNG